MRMYLSHQSIEGRNEVRLNCKEAGTMIVPFVRDTISDEELEDFSRHLKHCPDCREELEIYYTVSVGLENIKRDRFETYNLKGMFEEELRFVSSYLKWNKVLGAIESTLTVFASIGVVFATLLQFLKWF